MLKLICTLLAVVFLSACGYNGRDIEVVGQVKRVMNNTPLICGDFVDVDFSLGVLRNGVGSMSTQDIWIVISKKDVELAKKANESGQLVKIIYDNQRVPFCTEGRIASSIELLP